MYTYKYTQMYIHTALHGRDEPPAGQCRMGVSMGYPPLTQKLVLKKIILKIFLVLKNFLLWKNSAKWLIFVLLISIWLLLLHLYLFYLTH